MTLCVFIPFSSYEIACGVSSIVFTHIFKNTYSVPTAEDTTAVMIEITNKTSIIFHFINKIAKYEHIWICIKDFFVFVTPLIQLPCVNSK